MANRLKSLLHKLVSHNQGGFIKGRQILDNVILVQEMIHSSKSRKDKGMIIRIGMANAFDRVKHSFMYRGLEKIKFIIPFIMQIKACIGGLWIAPLINGRPFSFSKLLEVSGKDALSPLSFTF